MSDKPRLTVRPSRHGFIAQASRGDERWFSAANAPRFGGIAQEAPTRAEAEALVLQLAAEAMAAAPRA